MTDVVIHGVRVRVVDRVAHVVEEAVLVRVQLGHRHAGPRVLGAVGRECLGKQTQACKTCRFLLEQGGGTQGWIRVGLVVQVEITITEM